MSDDVDEATPKPVQALSAWMAERLAGADQDLLRRREPEAQVVRRELLRGATVAIVGVGWPEQAVHLRARRRARGAVDPGRSARVTGARSSSHEGIAGGLRARRPLHGRRQAGRAGPGGTRRAVHGHRRRVHVLGGRRAGRRAGGSGARPPGQRSRRGRRRSEQASDHARDAEEGASHAALRQHHGRRRPCRQAAAYVGSARGHQAGVREPRVGLLSREHRGRVDRGPGPDRVAAPHLAPHLHAVRGRPAAGGVPGWDGVRHRPPLLRRPMRLRRGSGELAHGRAVLLRDRPARPQPVPAGPPGGDDRPLGARDASARS